jgi:hypothetical protein
MANALYDKGREAFANAGINWSADTIKAILVDTSVYTPNLATDNFLSTIVAGARVGTAQTLASKTNVAGVVSAADINFTGLSAAPSIEAVVLYKDTGTEATSTLIAYIDTATGLPTTAGLSSVAVQWSTGPNKIFKL